MSGWTPAPGSEAPPPLPLPANALVMLVGASGSGKSWWARRCFRETQVVSSDRCRALVSDEEENQTVNREAFAVFYEILRQRLSLGRLTVADSTALSGFIRERMRLIAAQQGIPVHVVVIHTPLEALRENNRARERRVPEHILELHAQRFQQLTEERVLEAEGYAAVHHVSMVMLPRLRPQLLPAAPASRD
ncbi:MAG: AAA family ATPase [Longimicrobiaceae bacterium]